jgi:hypothetical protein
VLLPLVVVMLWMGVYPKPFLERTEQTVVELLEDVERNRLPMRPRLAEAASAPQVRTAGLDRDEAHGAVDSETDGETGLTDAGRVEEEADNGD